MFILVAFFILELLKLGAISSLNVIFLGSFGSWYYNFVMSEIERQVSYCCCA